jgi:putative sigma-54 modulation protein
MNVKFTARHFKAHETLKEHAQSGIDGLTKYYDGILNAEVILSFEKVQNSIKVAEIMLGVNGKTLSATGKSDEFEKAIDLAVEKIEAQLKKYKDKIRDVK